MKKTIVALLLLCLCLPVADAQKKRPSIPLEHGSHRIGRRTDAEMARWRSHGLGQFIHWGVYAIPGGQWEGSTYRSAAEWIRVWQPKDGAPQNWVEIYDNLYKQFDPTNFDAARWAKQARDMGARYMVFTTKHHDGFCMWPSKYTDYTVANTPYGKDIVGPLVDAYTREGIDVHFYFSIIDWNHKGYRAAVPQNDAERAAYEEFKAFTRNQLIELLTDYPQIKGLWFDGSWDKAWIAEAAWVDELGEELRAMHPGLIIGSRFRSDERGNRHYDANGDLIDDYNQTFERNLPETYAETNGDDWDCAMTIPQNQWGYHRDWSISYVKTPYELLEMMVHAVSMDGNLLLNFGPDGKGNIRREEAEIAAYLGKWLKANGEAIYGASHVDMKKQGWGYFTGKGNKLYLVVFNRPLNDRLRVEIPKGGLNPSRAYFLDGGKSAEIRSAGLTKTNSRLYDVVIPAKYKSDRPFVIAVETDGTTTSGEAYQQAKI